MKNIISRLGLCVLMALPGCGDGMMDYWFNHDGYVYEKSHANVMREFDFFGESDKLILHRAKHVNVLSLMKITR